MILARKSECQGCGGGSWLQEEGREQVRVCTQSLLVIWSPLALLYFFLSFIPLLSLSALLFLSLSLCHMSPVSRTCTAPLDRLKIFFQVQSLQGRKFTIVSCFRHMYSEGGLRSFWRGNGINVVKIAPESAIRFFAYEKVQQMFST